jgi:hypothetical protein
MGRHRVPTVASLDQRRERFADCETVLVAGFDQPWADRLSVAALAGPTRELPVYQPRFIRPYVQSRFRWLRGWRR